MSKTALAIAAFIGLAVLDGFLITVTFLGNDELQLAFMALFLIIAGMAFALKRYLLIYVAQSIVAALLIFRFIQSLQAENIITSGGIKGFFVPVALIVIGYGLAWLIARGISRPQISDH